MGESIEVHIMMFHTSHLNSKVLQYFMPTFVMGQLPLYRVRGQAAPKCLRNIKVPQ
jgi:hypothetical protein